MKVSQLRNSSEPGAIIHTVASRPRVLALRTYLFAARTYLFAATLFWLALSSPLFASPSSTSLPILTTIRSIHNLSPTEAARAYPIHLKAVITYYDPFLNLPNPPFFMVTDATGSIYVSTPSVTNVPYKPGVEVEVTGESEPGFFGPDIAHGVLRILGQAPLPPHPPRKTMTRLLTGSDDAQWVEVEAVVKSVAESGHNVTLKLALADGEVGATTIKQPGDDYDRLVDATIVLHALAGSLFNAHRQITGLQLVFPGLSTIQVELPSPEHPFDQPAAPIASLMNYVPERVFAHRVHMHGTVTLFWPGRMLCIQDDSGALCAQTAETSPATIGEPVDVIGFAQTGDVTPTLSDATYRTAAQHFIAARPIDAKQAFTGEQDARLVQIEGRLIAHDLASADPTIVLSNGGFTYPVVLPKSTGAEPMLRLEEGSLLRVTGICAVQAESSVIMRHSGYPIAKSFQIKLRSADDITILHKPSWWTARRVLRVLALALAITLAILCWGIFLRMRLKEQAKLLSFQATHDSLTGAWNRKAVLDFLHRETNRAAADKYSVGVIMIDADHFKNINDTYGHPAGDEVLKELARRIHHTVRNCDLTGRYGGEEFLVILSPGSLEQVQSCAERIRVAIADDPVHLDGFDLPITISLGTAMLHPAESTETEALAAADKALYLAKKNGRNQVISAEGVPSLSEASSSEPAGLRHHATATL